MINREFAEQFAKEWIAAWNAQDLPRILAHYSDDLQMSSPYIVQLAGVDAGVLQGKTAVAAYWQAALAQLPDLHFQHHATLTGVDSVTIYYHGVHGMAAEVLHFNQAGKVDQAYAHYA